jgi:hypothetical protein
MTVFLRRIYDNKADLRIRRYFELLTAKKNDYLTGNNMETPAVNGIIPTGLTQL